MRTFSLYSNSITKDMLLFDSYGDSGYGSVTGKLKALNIASSYLYVFEDTIVHKKDENWIPPEWVLFKSYHNGQIIESIPAGEQSLSIRHLFDNKFIPKDRQLTMVLSPLFINEDQYGLLLSEVDPGYFHYIKSLAAHLCTAMKILRLVRDKGEKD